MKVLLINDYGSPLGGAEIMTLTLREELRAQGHEVRIFSSGAREITGAGFADVYCFGADNPRVRMLSQVANPSAYYRLKRMLASFRPDVVHLRMFLWQLSPLILPLLEDIPTIYHVETYKPICPIGKKMLPDGSLCRSKQGMACYRNQCLSLPALGISMLQNQLWRRWATTIDVVTADSHFVGRQLRENGVEKVEVIWNGVPERPMRPPLPDQPLAVFGGRLTEEKGVETLLKAFAIARRQVPAAVLWIAGDGPDKVRLQTLCEGLELNGSVRFMGHLNRKEMEKHFETAWVQVIPSHWPEPFGIVAAEGMIRGTAVIASNIGGLGEIVRHESWGFQTEPFDVGSMAEYLSALLSDKPLAEKMGRRGRRFAMERLTMAVHADQVVDLFCRLTKKARPSTSFSG